VQIFDWAPSSTASTLDGNEVHVWRFSLQAADEERTALEKLLSASERGRASGIKLDTHRRRYVVGHGRLRRVLARYVDARAEEIEFGMHPRGKPFIAQAQNPMDLQFNFSHTADVAMVAVALGRIVGMDIEEHRSDVDMELIARRQFAPGEQDRFVSLPRADRRDAFYRCWTRKEAYLKAIGDGIAGGLQGFEVSFLPNEAPALLRAKGGADECKRWSIIAIDAGENLSAACVIEGAPARVLCLNAD
jgi:4'-phosphopantetheinyl transferase